MNIGGWIIMILSISVVTVMFIWCVVKIVRAPGETEKLHGFEETPPDIEP